jgi:hypothetical protein
MKTQYLLTKCDAALLERKLLESRMGKERGGANKSLIYAR